MISWENNNIIKLIVNMLIDIWMFPLYLIMKKSENNKDILLGHILKTASSLSNEYHTLTSFPRNEMYLSGKNFGKKLENDTAIVIQGPLIEEDDFTENSVKLYRTLFPGSKIIVSTWDTEDNEKCQKCRLNGAEIVLSKMPENVGAINVNCQIVSSRAGIERAKELGSKYVLKIRSDQRITRSSALELLKNSLRLYHVAVDGKLSARIVFLGNLMNSYNALAFHISDFMMFGLTHDVLKVFTIPLDTRPYAFQEDVLKVYKKQYEFAWEKECNDKIVVDKDLLYNHFILKLMAPEQYLLFEFVKQHITRIDEDKEDFIKLYWNIMQKYLIVIDGDALGLYWYKRFFKYSQPDIYKRGNRCGKLTHTRWLDLYLDWVLEDESHSHSVTVLSK